MRDHVDDGMGFRGLVSDAQEKLESKDDRILTCVYCGQAYPQDTPTWGNQVLTDHIKICPKHPMRKSEETIAKLRSALAGLVGVDGKDELDKMEAALRLVNVPDVDKVTSINAVNVLRETLAETAVTTRADTRPDRGMEDR